MKEIKRYAKYTCGKNGVAKDGHTMFIKDIVKDLNRKSYLEERYTDHKAVVETMQKRIDELEADNETFKTDLVDLAIDLQILITEGMSAKKQMTILDKAESIITKFDN